MHTAEAGKGGDNRGKRGTKEKTSLNALQQYLMRADSRGTGTQREEEENE